MEKWGKKDENAGEVYKVHGRYGLKNVKWESDNRVVSENQEKLKIYENEWNRLKTKRKTDLGVTNFERIHLQNFTKFRVYNWKRKKNSRITLKSNLQKVCSQSSLNVPAIKERYRYRTSVFLTVSHSCRLTVQLSAHEFHRSMSSQLRHLSTIRKKLVKQQYLLHMSSQYDELGPLAAEIISLVWGTAANFKGFRVLAALYCTAL